MSTPPPAAAPEPSKSRAAAKPKAETKATEAKAATQTTAQPKETAAPQPKAADAAEVATVASARAKTTTDGSADAPRTPWHTRFRTPALIAAAVLLVGASAAMTVQVSAWTSEREAIEAQLTDRGEAVAEIRTQVAELAAELDLTESQTAAAEEWQLALDDLVADERAFTAEWRAIAEALQACNAARRQIAIDARAKGNGAVASAERSANSQCAAAIAAHDRMRSENG